MAWIAEIEADPAAIATMKRAAQAGQPREVCGALFGCCDFDAWWRVGAAHPLDNHAADTEREYLITADQVRFCAALARARGIVMVGFFHSHPRGGHTPSPVDLSRAWPGYLYAIVDGISGVIGYWTLAEDRGSFRSLGTHQP